MGSKEDEADGVDALGDAGARVAQGLLDFDLGELRTAIIAQIVKRCGERRYWEKWADSVTDIARRHDERIRALIESPGGGVSKRFDEFVAALRHNLNDSITRDNAAAMLSQHLITRPVFDALFGGQEFTERNPVSLVMQRMVNELEGYGLEAETAELAEFYASVRRRVEGIDNAEGKQHVVVELYERFFKVAYPKVAESLGIVYTPVEIVDFIIRGVRELLRREFDASLSDEGVHILDPFVGTGTFITRLLQSGFIDRDALVRKYASELHANEIMLLVPSQLGFSNCLRNRSIGLSCLVESVDGGGGSDGQGQVWGAIGVGTTGRTPESDSGWEKLGTSDREGADSAQERRWLGGSPGGRSPGRGAGHGVPGQAALCRGGVGWGAVGPSPSQPAPEVGRPGRGAPHRAGLQPAAGRA